MFDAKNLAGGKKNWCPGHSLTPHRPFTVGRSICPFSHINSRVNRPLSIWPKRLPDTYPTAWPLASSIEKAKRTSSLESVSLLELLQCWIKVVVVGPLELNQARRPRFGEVFLLVSAPFNALQSAGSRRRS